MIKKLSDFIGQYKKYALLVPILVLLDVVCEMSMPLLMAKVIDTGIAGRDIGYIARIGLYMTLLALGAIFIGIINARLTTYTSIGFGANLRDALFEKVQAFSFTNIDHFSTASLITRLTNDVNVLQMTFMMMLRIMLRAPMMLVVAFFMAIQINAELSIVMAVAIPLVVFGILVVIRIAVPRFTIMQEKIDAINNTLQENLIGIRVVKSFVTEKLEINKFQISNDALTNAAMRASKIVIFSMPMMMLVINMATIAIIWLGGKMVFAGTLGTGELISFLTYVMHILMSIMMLSMVILMSARAKASGTRIIEVLDTRIDIKDREPVGGTKEYAPVVKSGKVEFRNVCFKYNLSGSGELVLKDINLICRPGQVIGVVGGTGDGKSTLVHLIPRLYDATEGAVLVDDVDVRDYRLDDLRSSIGMVLQKNTLFSGTIRENLIWGNPDATREEIEAACRDAQAHDFILSFPNGYDTVLGRGGVNVSGGQKQRLCIARAMLKKPKILILDDSTSAVDSTTEARIRESFYKNLAGTTVFIIAQRISSVCDADQIIVLDDGKIAGMGTHAELIASNTIYQEINASQQEGAVIHG